MIFITGTYMHRYSNHIYVYFLHLQHPDGGGSVVISTDPANLFDEKDGWGQQVKCMNVPRAFYNEDNCILSNLPTACAPNEKPKEVIILNDSNLESIRTLTSRALYAVTGLALSSVMDQSTGYNAPCATNDKNQWSRWIKDPADTACNNTASLGPGTYKIFQDLIEGTLDIGYLNENIVDVKRRYRKCDRELPMSIDLHVVYICLRCVRLPSSFLQWL